MRTQNTAENIFNKGVLVLFKTSVWTGRVKIPPRVLTEHKNVDPRFINIYKYLIDPESLRQIEKIRNTARSFLYNHSLPFPVEGVVMLPVGLIPEIEARMKEFESEFWSAVEEFAQKYEEFKRLAESALGDLYNPAEYPNNIKSKFNFYWSYYHLSTPTGQLRAVSPELVQREQEKFKQMIDEFRETAITALRDRFISMISNLADRLSTGKKFKRSSVEHFQDFLNHFEQLNINDDHALQEAVERAKQLISGVSAEDLKDNQFLREAIGKELEKVHDWSVKQLEDMPVRKIIRKR